MGIQLYLTIFFNQTENLQILFINLEQVTYACSFFNFPRDKFFQKVYIKRVTLFNILLISKVTILTNCFSQEILQKILHKVLHKGPKIKTQ